jgi:hypothetical protein
MPPGAAPSVGRRYAYAIFEPAADAPGFLLRRALEEHAGDPAVTLAASDYGALLLAFASAESREATMASFPLEFAGHLIRLERPEDGANRASWGSPRFAKLTATGFPHEHWDADGIRAAFAPLGSVCCIDPACLQEQDFSAVRVVIKMASDCTFPTTLIVHDPFCETASEVTVRLVRSWTGREDFLSSASLHFDIDGAGRAGDGRAPRLSDIDEGSVPGSPPTPPPAPRELAPAVLNLWNWIVARRQSNLASAAALEAVDGLPAETSLPLPRGQAPPPEVWDRVLANRLASEFPESGLDATQVMAVVPSPALSPAFRPNLSSPPLLLQWYDSLRSPPTATSVELGAHGVETEGAAPDSLPLELATTDEGDDLTLPVHEDSARKQRVHHKRATDNAFKARRSSRLAAKEAPTFVTMLAKAKKAKASRFDLSGASPHFRAAAEAAGFCASSDPGPIPVPHLRALAAACGINADAVEAADSVPSSSA